MTRAGGLILVWTVATSFFCAQAQNRPTSTKYAEVNGETITDETLVEAGGAQFAQLEQQIYSWKLQKLKQIIEQRCLANEAAKRGLSVDELLAAEVRGKVAAPSDAQVDEFYNSHRDEFKAEETDALRQRIRDHLITEKTAARRDEFIASLKQQQGVKEFLPTPPIFRAHVSTEGAPVRGSAQAPIAIVEFEDFQCPYCKRSQSVLAQLLAKYPSQVKIVHRDFPLESIHPAARRAHEAAHCAGNQNKFWEYADVLYANAPAASPVQLQAYAQQIGLDADSFQHCMDGRASSSSVDKDVQEGSQLGVTATPTFFVNGRWMSSTQKIEEFERVIDDELARMHSSPAPADVGN